MLSNRLEDARIQQEQRKNTLKALISSRLAAFERAVVFTDPNLFQLRLELKARMQTAPRNWDFYQLQQGVDDFIRVFVRDHQVPERVTKGWMIGSNGS